MKTQWLAFSRVTNLIENEQTNITLNHLRLTSSRPLFTDHLLKNNRPNFKPYSWKVLNELTNDYYITALIWCFCPFCIIILLHSVFIALTLFPSLSPSVSLSVFFLFRAGGRRGREIIRQTQHQRVRTRTHTRTAFSLSPCPFLTALSPPC